MFVITVALFCGILAFAGYKPDTASIDCHLVWYRDAPDRQSYAIDLIKRPIRVGDQVCVHVTLGKGAAMAADQRSIVPPRPIRRWHLLLNGADIAVSAGRDPAPGDPLTLSFVLPAPTSTTANTAATIASLWSGGLSSTELGSRLVSLRLHADAIGQSLSYDLLRNRPVQLLVFNPYAAIAGIILLVVFTAGIVWLARNTALLRDESDADSPTSLARTQMAFWFALTIAGFCYIWLLTGIWQDVVNPTALILLGISATTGIGATTIASPKSAAWSAGFLLDILSDQASNGVPAGVAVHRLVMATWTIVLGGVFVSTVLWTERFPTFDPVLLTLMGITSGVYVGFKWLER